MEEERNKNSSLDESDKLIDSSQLHISQQFPNKMSWFFLVIKRYSLVVIAAIKAKKNVKYLLRYFRSNF